MNVLIVEDDLYLSTKIQEAFLKKTITNKVRRLYSYNDFLHETNLGIYDIIILDIMLWEDMSKSWMQILEHLRKKHATIPIIIISSISDCAFLERAFSLGAHDYMVKPFRIKELQIRAQRWLQNYVFAEYYSYQKELNYYWLRYFPQKHEFYFWDQLLKLGRSNKYLLSLFLINREKLLTQVFLAEKIWWDVEAVTEKNLRIKVFRLKKQLQDFWLESWVQTIRWEGYIFECPSSRQS